MNERLLQFIWQFRYFNQSTLSTTDGKPLQIIHPGHLNRNSGPDFSEARIKTGDTTWVGNIELHVYASHWYQHKHASDKNYNNVILHVVWNDDMDLQLPFPTLELQNRVSKLLLKKYQMIVSLLIILIP